MRLQINTNDVCKLSVVPKFNYSINKKKEQLYFVLIAHLVIHHISVYYFQLLMDFYLLPINKRNL